MKRKVLFLCTGNSARSILAEYLLRSMDPRFESHSAGAEPTGRVHPVAIEVLKNFYGIDASSAESKSWTAFDGARFDVVITVCDHARDTCPLWPGSSAIIAHWGSPDPVAVDGDAARVEVAFRRVAEETHHRLERFCALPFARATIAELAEAIQRIGQPAEAPAIGTRG
ncbi:MAG: arsenate reductase ArsC [bacterium]|nr:arsenate reductase ArsC [bacterium]